MRTVAGIQNVDFTDPEEWSPLFFLPSFPPFSLFLSSLIPSPFIERAGDGLDPGWWYGSGVPLSGTDTWGYLPALYREIRKDSELKKLWKQGKVKMET